MKPLAIAFALSTLMTAQIPCLAWSPPSDVSDCQSAIYAVASDIDGRLKAPIAEVFLDKLDPNPHSPFPESKHLRIVLDGYGQTESIMNNKNLEMAYARALFDFCPDVSMVGFALYQANWMHSFYRFPDGSIRPQFCLTVPGAIDDGTPWGFGHCD